MNTRRPNTSLELQSEAVQLSTGQSFEVFENDWTASRKLNRLMEEAEAAGDQTAFGFFCRVIYPLLAATAQGDVPDARAAYALPPADLDAWYRAVWKLNPDWVALPVGETAQTEEITFRDGSSLTLSQSLDLPSFMLRVAQLEDDAAQAPAPDPDVQVFKLNVYPKMAGCVIDGEVPPAEIVARWPSAERTKWYAAAERLNPDWFAPLNAELEEYQRAQQEKEKQSKKKEGKRPAG